MLMKSDTEAQLACLLKLNNVYSTSCLFSSLCNLQTLACDLALTFSAQACKFTPSAQYIISRKPDIFLWTDLATKRMLLIPCQICIFLGKWKTGFFSVFRWRAIAPSRYLCFTLPSKLALPETPQRGSHNSLARTLYIPNLWHWEWGEKRSIFRVWAKPKA